MPTPNSHYLTGSDLLKMKPDIGSSINLDCLSDESSISTSIMGQCGEMIQTQAAAMAIAIHRRSSWWPVIGWFILQGGCQRESFGLNCEHQSC